MNKSLNKIIPVCYVVLSIAIIFGIVDIIISFSKNESKTSEITTSISDYETTSITTSFIYEETSTGSKIYTLGVYYFDKDTHEMIRSFDLRVYSEGSRYSIRPVDIPGYTPEDTIRTGVMTENTIIVFYYKKVGETTKKPTIETTNMVETETTNIVETETTNIVETETTTVEYITMPNICGQVLTDAKKHLSSLGFTNISTKSDKSIWLESNWTVQTQNIEPGQLISLDTNIVLFCVKTEDYIPPDDPIAVMPDVCYQLYSTALQTLRALGFVNIDYDANGSFIIIDSNWTVIKQSVAPGKEIEKGTSIVLTCVKTTEYLDNLDVTMIDVVGLNASDAEKKLSDAGFRNVRISHYSKANRQKSISGESNYVVISQSVKKGTTIKAGNEVVITCELKTVTIKNNIEFANLMAMTSQSNYTTMRNYANNHNGEIIEFDGCILDMLQDKNYSTIFDVAILGVNYGTIAKGPIFVFEDVSYSGMYVNGASSVAVGMNFRITAKIIGYNEAGYIILSPVSLISR
ncbi:MAG: DUF4839 domain-containing protein [Clostridiales bacterium]|nr:DUF4839 domain-containing protein [Clostridiales bacterium]